MTVHVAPRTGDAPPPRSTLAMRSMPLPLVALDDADVAAFDEADDAGFEIAN